MALNPEESRCIDALCSYLSHRGTAWAIIDDSLDSKYPNEPTPEAIISNDADTVAVEVKGLVRVEDGRFWKQYKSLSKSLQPTCPGNYVLVVPHGWTLQSIRPFIRGLKTQTEELCPTLVPGQTAFVRVPRKSQLTKVRSEGAWVRCCHPHDAAIQLDGQVGGGYFLADQGPDHSFCTDDCRDRFRQRLLTAAGRIRDDDNGIRVEWEEEWELKRTESNVPRLSVLGFVQSFWVEPAVSEALRVRIRDANKKFHHRWADRHAVILDNAFTFASMDDPRNVFQGVDPEEYDLIDDVYLLDRSGMKSVFARQLPPRGTPSPALPATA